MMKVLTGNIFDSECQTIVNAVNCVGVMGKGIALEFKKKYPDMFLDYKIKCDRNEVKVGIPYFYNDTSGKKILNFPTKNHWRGKSEISFIKDGLEWFLEHYVENEVTSIAFSALGCGNGGLNWDVVGKIMFQKLSRLPIEIEIYAPIGTTVDKLSEVFLSSEIEYDKVYHRKNITVSDEEIKMIGLAVTRLVKANPVLNIGKTILTDLIYVLKYYDKSISFDFKFGKYGVYCDSVENVIEVLINNNYISKDSEMNSKSFVINEKLESEDVLSNEKKEAIDRTVSFFKNLKNSKEVHFKANILFAYNQNLDVDKEKQRQAVIDYLRNRGLDIEMSVFDKIWPPKKNVSE